MPDLGLKCPSCGGHKLVEIEHHGRVYWQCVNPVTKNNGRHGKSRREWLAPCGFWTTKETAWVVSDGR